MRALERARQEVERATATRDHAVAARGELLGRLARAGARSGRATAGALVTRDAYRGDLRTRQAAMEERIRVEERALQVALDGLTEAQKQVEQALRAREATERQRAAEDKALARRRERRDQAATDDRWRPPRR